MDFGFGINRSSTIDLTKTDNGLFRKVCSEEPGARTCMACGSCSATCMASDLSGMSIRKVLLAMQRGQDIRHMLSKCMLCGKCTMVCPRGINTRRLVLTICRLYD